MPADICACSARQVHRRALEVVGRPPAAGGDAGADAGEALGVAEQGRVHLRLNVARGDGVDGDALAGPLVGEALGDLADGTLGRGVRGHCQAALEGEQRGKVDDAAAAAGGGRGRKLQHVGADVAAEGEDGVEVYLDDLRCMGVLIAWRGKKQEKLVRCYLIKVAVGKLLAGVPALDTRAVDEDANLVAVGENLGRQGGNLLLDSHVGRVDPSLAAERLDKVFRLGDAGVALCIISSGSIRHSMMVLFDVPE